MKHIIITILFLFTFLSEGVPQAVRWEVLFTTPGSLHCRVIERLCHYISHAESSIDAALYDLNNKKVIKALSQASARGVVVRLVMESDNYFTTDLSALRKRGLSIVHDRKKGLMHNKFFIFDRSLLWTGSLNITDNGSRRNNNNAILLKSSDLAEEFTEEFEEMFSGRVFGNKMDSRPFPWLHSPGRVGVGDIHVTARFAPEDDVEGELIKYIRKAEKSIRFMAFSFTSDTLGEALVKGKSRGLDIKGIVERRGSGTSFSEYIKLLVEGIEVRRDGNPRMMHHKVFIIDDSLVVTGSYNFSKGAGTRNDENILFIESRKVAEEYMREFKKLYRLSTPFRRKK